MESDIHDADNLSGDHGNSNDRRQMDLITLTQLETLKLEYETQLDALRLQLETGRKEHKQRDITQDLHVQYQKETDELRHKLDAEGRQQLELVLSKLDDIVQCNFQEHQTKFKDELNLQIQAVRLTLDQIYHGQLKLATTELDTRHQQEISQLRESLANEHKEEIEKLEADWSRRFQELEDEHQDELNESVLQDSLKSEQSRATILHNLNKKMTEEHKQLLQQISDGLKKSPLVSTPKKRKYNQECQTESEDGDTETESIRSMPVTGEEFQHLEEREKVIDKAGDIHKTLECQREEIAQLRARMLTEYEQLLITRTEVMSHQTEEVEKLQHEIEELKQMYEDQIQTFQSKIESQTEEAIQSRLNEMHQKEIDDLKSYYEAELSKIQADRADRKVTTGNEEMSSEYAESDEILKEKEYIKSTTLLTVISDDEDENESETKPIQNADEHKQLIKEKETLIAELSERIDIENRSNLELREKLIQGDEKLIEMEKMLRTRQCEIEELKNKLCEKDAVLKILETEKTEMEEKGIRDVEECEIRQNKIIEELNEKLINIQKELEASQEQEQLLEEQLNEIQESQNALQLSHEEVRQDLEREHQIELSTLQSEGKVQLEIELKRQAADLAFDHQEKFKALKQEYEEKLLTLNNKEGKPSENAEDQEIEDDSTGTTSTVVDNKLPEGVKVTEVEEVRDKTDDDTDNMEVDSESLKNQKNVLENESENISADEVGKVSDGKSESEATRTDSRSSDFESESIRTESRSSDVGGSLEVSDSEGGTPRDTQVKHLFGEIAKAKEQTFAKLRDEYEGKIKKLNDDLDKALAVSEDKEKQLKDVCDEYEDKISVLRAHYEQKIKDIEEDNIEHDIESIKENLRSEFLKKNETELAQVHTEYEEKMELLKQELQEGFDMEKQELLYQQQTDLEKAEEKYEDLVERIRNGDAPEVAEILQEKYDTELEMAKTLMQQEFEETLESEQQRLIDIHEQNVDKVVAEHEQETNDLKQQFEKDIAECRKSLSSEYQTKIQEVEQHYNDEIEKLKLDMQVMVEQRELAQSEEVKVIPEVTKQVAVSTTSSDTDPGNDINEEIGTESVAVLENDATDGDVNDVVEVADLSNSLLGLKGSHAAAIAQIEAEYERKLDELREGLHQEYEEKITKLRAELSTTHTEDTPESVTHKEDTKEDQIEDREDLERKLSEKHAKDLRNMEMQYDNRMDDMKQHYQAEIENLQKVLSYFQQTASPVNGVDELPKLSGLELDEVEEENLEGARPKSSTPREPMEGEGHIDRVEIIERGTPPQKVSPRGEVIPPEDDEPSKTEKSINLINFDTSGENTPLKPPLEKPPAVPRDAGIDLTIEEEVIIPEKSKSRETTPRAGDQSDSFSQNEEESGSRCSTPTDLLQTRQLADTLQDFQPASTYESSTELSTGEPTSLASELREKECRIKELEMEIDSMQDKFNDIISRRERENEESRNLEMMLRSDLERINTERCLSPPDSGLRPSVKDNIQSTNEHLLQLLSDAVKTYMNVEEAINKKLAKVVAVGGAEKSPKVERRSPPAVPESPPGAEGGDAPQETSILSNLTDEGLDLSQRISESIFQGPELDTEGEELLTDASNRLQGSVTRLLDMIEDTTNQLYDTKRTQKELVTSVSSGQQESFHMTTKVQDLEERLQEEVEAKEYLAMELHKAEGLIEGYSTERDNLEQRIQDLEEKKEALVLELETTKNRLQDLEQSHHEALSLRTEMQRQQSLMEENVGEEAQVSKETAEVAPPTAEALMLEINRLNEEKRLLEQQARTVHEKYETRIHDLENAGEETERHYVIQLEERKAENNDLRLQLENVEKQLKSNRQFLDEQAAEIEQEREEYQREVDKWKQIVQSKEKQEQAENRLKREVDNLTEELQSRIDSHSEIVLQTEKLQRDLSDKQMTAEELQAVVKDLEQEIEEKNVSEKELHKKIIKLEKALNYEEKELEPDLGNESPTAEGDEPDSDTGTTSSETTRAYRRRRKLPSHISLQQEEALIQEKEQLQTQLEEQLIQISALRNQLDEMRHRGDYGDDSQTSTLQRQLSRQKEVSEEFEKEIAELKEQLTDATNSLNNKDKYISQLSNQIQSFGQESEKPKTNEHLVEELSQENEELKAKLKSAQGELRSTPMPVLTQSLMEEKNQEIDHLNAQISQLEQELEQIKSGETLSNMQQELNRLQEEIDRRDMDNVRASQVSNYSVDTDTEGPPAVSESFTEKTNLQQELQESVAHNLEEISELKEENERLEKVIQEKEVEINQLREDLQNKRETSPKSDDIGYNSDLLQEKEHQLEEMTAQIEGLNSEIYSLTDFQNKLQEDFDTVQTMLEEKEKEIEILTKELTEKSPIDSESVSNLEVELQKMKKDLKEKDNVIDEKAEEMYLLNEKLEQQELDIKEVKSLLVAKESELVELKEKAPSSEELQEQVQEKTNQLEEKTVELEKMRLEFDTVKEHLAIAENLQRKLEQAGMLGPDILMKEKEKEIQELKAELSSLKEKLQSDFEEMQHQQNQEQIQRLISQVEEMRKQVQGNPCEDLISEDDIDFLRKRLKEAESQEEINILTDEMMKLRHKMGSNDMQKLVEKNDQIRILREELDGKEDQIRILREGLDGKDNQTKMLREEIDERDCQVKVLREELEEGEDQIKILREGLDGKNDQTRVSREELDERDSQIKAYREHLDERDEQIRILREELDEKEDQVRNIRAEFEEKEKEIEIFKEGQDVQIRIMKEELANKEEEMRIFKEEKDGNIQSLIEELAEKETQMLVFRDELKEKDDQIKTLRKEDDDLQGSLEEFKEQEQAIGLMRVELDEKEDQIHVLREELNSKENQIRQLTENLDKNIRTFKEELDQKEGKFATLKENLDENEEEIRALRRDVDEKTDEIDFLKKQQEKRGNNSSALIEELEDKNMYIKKLEKDLKTLDEKEEEIKLMKAELQGMVSMQEHQEEARMFSLAQPSLYQEAREEQISIPSRETVQMCEYPSHIPETYAKMEATYAQGDNQVVTENRTFLYPASEKKENMIQTRQLDNVEDTMLSLPSDTIMAEKVTPQMMSYPGEGVMYPGEGLISYPREGVEMKTDAISGSRDATVGVSLGSEAVDMVTGQNMVSPSMFPVQDRDNPKLLEVHELETMVRTRDKEIENLRTQLELSTEQQNDSHCTISELKDQIGWLQQEVETLRQLRTVQDNNGSETIQDKDKEIQTLQNEIISLKSKMEKVEDLESELEHKNDLVMDLEEECEKLKKNAEENMRKLQEQMDRIKSVDEAEDKWAMLQSTQERLEKTTYELTDTTQKLHQVEDRLGEVNHKLSDRENDYQQLQGDYWEAKAQLSESSNHMQVMEQQLDEARKELNDRNLELKTLQEEMQSIHRDSGISDRTPLQRSKIELDEMIHEKDQELEDVKQRLKEAVELSEQQLHLVEQKDEEFVKLKIEIQQMIAEKDKVIKDLKKQVQSVTADKDLLQQETERQVKVIDRLENDVQEFKVREVELERDQNAVSMVSVLQGQIEERDQALREIHNNLQNTQEKLQEKTQELNHVKERIEAEESSKDVVPPETQRQLDQVKAELKVAKKALDDMQRQGGWRTNSTEHIPPLRLQDSEESDEELELKDVEELRKEIIALRKELQERKSELQLFHNTSSMSAKDYVEKVMKLREELGQQHQRHIADLTERSRQESNETMAQLRIRYEDEIESQNLLHKTELEKKTGEVKREMEKEHEKEINKLLARHQEEIELLKIREPLLSAQDSSTLDVARQIRSEVIRAEQLDNQNMSSFHVEGQDNLDASTVASGDTFCDENIPTRLRVLLNRLHNEGVQALTMSELQFLNRSMAGQGVDRDADIASLQAAWMNEKQSLLSAVQSLKDLLAQTHKFRNAEKAADVSDWRGELLRSIGYVFAKERETLLAELRSHVLSHPSTDFSEIQKLEQNIRNQEVHQKESLDQIFKADRQSMLAEIRDLRAHASINSMRYQEEKERLADQLNTVEDSSSKRERQLKRQVQLLEYKLQQEKIIQDDLRTSLEAEQDRTSELSNQISREKNSNLDLQGEITAYQVQISKLKDGLEREQSRFVSVTAALEEEKGKCQHLSEILEKERSVVRAQRRDLEDLQLTSEERNKMQDILENLQAELDSERERNLQLENAQQADKAKLSTLKHDLEMEQKTLRTEDLEHKAKVKQMTTALELERARSADLQSALDRERNLNEKLRQNLDAERRSLLESTDRENSIVEDMQMELESEKSRVAELKVALDREKRRIASNLDTLECERDKNKEDLEQERLTNRQLRHELDQSELQKLDLTRHYEHERDQSTRLKNEREKLRSEVKTLKDLLNERQRSHETEKVSEKQSYRQLERERDDNRMKLHENELEIQRLTQKVLDLEERVTTSREKELDTLRELEQEKLRALHSQTMNGDSVSPRSSASDSQERWAVYKTQLESICQSLQFLILQYQDQMGHLRSAESLAEVISLEKPLKDLLAELKQMQMPLAFESECETNLLLRPNAHAINERVLHHNSELTNFVSRLTEEKMELRNTLSRLEEEIWRYRQHDGSMQNGDLNTSHTISENQHLEERANWAKERLSLQLALNKAESEKDRYKSDLRIERERRSSMPLMNGHGSDADKDKIQRLYGKYLRADSYRKALIYQKKYLLLLLGGFQDCEETTLALIARMGVYPSPEDMQRQTKYSRAFTTFRSAARVVIAIARMKFLVRKWQRATRVGSPVMGGTVDPKQGYTPQSRSYSPPRISASPHLTSASPVGLARTPLSSYHSTLPTDLRASSGLNGASPYAANYRGSGGRTPYTPVSPFNAGLNGSAKYSIHMTPPTKDYNPPKYSSESSGARRKLISSASNTPKSTTPSSQRRVKTSEEQQPSLHDDYIARLENLQIRLGSMESDSPKSRTYPRR